MIIITLDKTLKFVEEVEAEIDHIWLEEPHDVFALKNGCLPSGAGIYNQYFSVLVMLSGEMRTLAIHIFADLIDLGKKQEFEMIHLRLMVKRMLTIDCGVIGYFGLPSYANFLDEYYDLVEKVETKDEFLKITKSMFTLTNRYQMWLHQIFPWSLSMFFKQKNPEEYKELYEKLTQKEKKS
ncbi:hypothetical protein [Alteribacillus sp. YIM 98480]|uniref:cucumopine synthase-related protein n=1 Tax=Alteribacillus sp. YIM 98480 TaxID=2606599 RepID=UPI00131EACBC|nr:hypothetical protein [Alteribacillus sp. YIM 98480]